MIECETTHVGRPHSTCGAMLCAAAESAHAQQLVGVNIGNNTLISINPTTGAFSPVGPIGVGQAMNGLAYDGNHGILYGVDTSIDRLVRINPLTGAGTIIGPFNNALNPPSVIYLIISADASAIPDVHHS